MKPAPFSVPKFSRRALLAGAAALVATRAAAQSVASFLNATEFGLAPNAGGDQSGLLQTAINAAAQSGLPLFLPGGFYMAANIVLPSGIAIHGVPGATVLKNSGGGIMLAAEGQSDITLQGLAIDGDGMLLGADGAGLVSLRRCANVRIADCAVGRSSQHGIYLENVSGRVSGTAVRGAAQTGLHLQDSAGMLVTGNVIEECGNGGVRVWRFSPGPDGTIVTGNRISEIGSGSGNGQNGNGVNVFQADEVIVSDNHIADCAFTAVRANTTRNTIISGNQCLNSGEVAIFSEFGFSGSIIADNLIDGAATGISITNFDYEGRLATCTGNIVRNITPRSLVNPDTRPVGIYAEADVAVSGNVVDTVPGVGIAVGWGPFLRNALVSDNVVRDVEIGIGVSVAEGAGRATVSGNLISGARMGGIAALRWTEPASLDLVADAARFPNVTLSGNVVSG